ncbi:MAG TPA: hypothetical protein VFM55_09455 [Micromonosporaceae bacterium]|nr:hypothetical protein [Micromonosporaceae bacterium]
MNAALALVRRFLADYARNPVNLLLLVLVPVVFVLVAAGSLVEAAKLLGGAGHGAGVATATAGWAAGFLAGVAMYFQASAARDADRALVLAGLPARRLVAARLLTGLGLAVLASAAALAALQLRAGIDDPARTVAGTLMFAVIYLGIGAVVGAGVRSPVNGTVLVLFVWILDVFLGPTMGTGTDKAGTRLLPTHFVSLWMTDLPLHHGGRLGDLGVALVWTAGALALAFAVTVVSVRVAGRHRLRARPGSARDQLAAATRMGWRDWRRNPVLWLLLVAVPAVFILLAQAVTPHQLTSIVVAEDGVRAARVFDVFDLHAGTMAPVAVASLATLAGLFVVLDTGPGDRRLALVGLRPGILLAARLVVVGVATGLATGVSLAVTAMVFEPRRWGWYAGANALVAVTYALVGVLVAPVFGRVAGVFVAFLVPFVDVGIGQSPMLRGEPAAWAEYLPGYGAYRVLVDGGLTAGFDETGSLLLAISWVAALAVAATVLVRRTIRPTW